MRSTTLLLASVPTWVPVVSAGAFALIGTLAGALASVEVGRRTAVATAKAASERTIAEDMARSAAWQERKRELYGEFLAAGRTVRDGAGDAGAAVRYGALRDRVLLFASEDAGRAVVALPDDLKQVDGHVWNELIAKLQADALLNSAQPWQISS